MIDDNSNVLKTFNDYTEEEDVQFIKLSISGEHPWKNKAIRDIILPPDTLLVMIVRDKETIVPKGNTVLLDQDIAVLSAPSFHDNANIQIKEWKVQPNSEYDGKQISEISQHKEALIILIKRNGENIIPNGKTVLQANDILVINSME